MLLMVVLLLTVICIALQLCISGIDLAKKVGDKSRQVKGKKQGKIGKVVDKSTDVLQDGIKKVSSFILVVVKRLRDLFLAMSIVSLIIDVCIFIILVSASAGFLALFCSTDDNGNLIMSSDVVAGLTASKRTGVGTSGTGSADLVSVAGKPPGLTDKSWNSADDIGKAMVTYAYNQLHPRKKELIYSKDHIAVGYCDCSTFVCGILEGATKRTFSGKKSKGYDFNVNKKTDLTGYMPTGTMRSYVNSHKEVIVGHTSTDISKCQPGDILLTDGHVVIYVGVREKDKKHILVHSSEPGADCSKDIECTNKDWDVGFKTFYGKHYYIIRTSKLLGINK